MTGSKPHASARWPLLAAVVLLGVGLIVLIFFLARLNNAASDSGAVLIRPEQSLQEALNRAQAGDVLELVSGATYQGPAAIKTQGVTLRSNGSAPAIIEGTLDADQDKQDVLLVLAADVQVQNLELRGGARGLVVDGATGCRILGNRLVDNEVGLEASEADKLLIQDNQVEGSEFMGISISRAVTDTHVERNRVTKAKGLAIRVANSTDIVIQANEIDASPELEIGVQVSLGERISVLDNHVRSITQRDVGILIEVSHASQITANHIEMAQIGIQEDRARDNAIRRNRVQGTTLAIRSSMSNGTVIEENVIDNVMIGIYVLNAEDVKVSGNQVSNAQQFGLDVEFMERMEVAQNTVTKSAAGMMVAFVNNSRFEQNALSDNQWGMAVLQSNGNAIAGNQLKNNAQAGLTLMFTSTNNTVQNNQLQGNRIGMWTILATANQILRNEVRDNAIGLSLSHAGGGTDVIENLLQANGKGILVEPLSGIEAANTVLSVFDVRLSIPQGGDNTGYRIARNNFVDNREFGLENLDTTLTLEADQNWWGQASGPAGAGNGSGNAVSQGVSVSPWLFAEADWTNENGS